MRIAILCHASVGGSGVVAAQLALALAELGYDVHVLGETVPFRLKPPESDPAKESPPLLYRDLGSAPPPQTLWGRLAAHARESISRYFRRSNSEALSKGSIRFHEIRPFEYPLFDASLITLRTANALAAVVEKHNIDLVHAHYAIPHATSALLARDAGLPFKIVTTLHGTDVTTVGVDLSLRYTTRHAINHSDLVTAVSRSLVDAAKDLLGIKREILHIPNWIDAERFVPNKDSELRRRFAQPEETLLIHVSNFRAVKRSTDVVRVFEQVAAKRAARLILVGEGPDKMQCIELAERLGVNGRLLSLPPRPDVEKLIGLADVLLLPSQSEAFPLVALEAMACRTIVVASDVGGLPEMIEHGRTGFLHPVGDIAGMAASVLQVMDDAAGAEQVRAAAQAEVSENYSPAKIIPRYAEIYRATVSPRPAGQAGRESVIVERIADPPGKSAKKRPAAAPVPASRASF